MGCYSYELINLENIISNDMEKQKKFEIYFYSILKGFEFKIDSTFFSGLNLTLIVLPQSKPITIKYEFPDKVNNKIFTLNSDHQVIFPNTIPSQSLKSSIYRNIKILPESTPFPIQTPQSIPISVGLYQMNMTGDIKCNFNKNDNPAFAYNCGPDLFGTICKASLPDNECSLYNLSTPEAYHCGIVCNTSNGIFEYSFKGIQFAIYGTFSPDFFSFSVYIDGIMVGIINENKDIKQEFSLLYISDELEYDFHTIQLKGMNELFEIYKIVYWPLKYGKRINASEILPRWDYESDQIGGLRFYPEYINVTKKMMLNCSKLLVYSSKDFHHGIMKLEIKGKEFSSILSINLSSNSRIDGVLVYESDFIPLDNYEISFIKASRSILLYCLYYLDIIPPTPLPTNSPKPTETPTPSSSKTPTKSPTPSQIPISVGIDQINITGSVTIANRETCPSSFIPNNPCGKTCWYDPFEHRLALNLPKFEYTFIGEQFQIYGVNDPSHKRCALYLDNEFVTYINQYQQNREMYVCQYTSNLLPYGKHTIQIIGINETFEIYKFTYWPSVNAKRINSTEISPKWMVESDNIGGLRELLSNSNLTKKTSLRCSKIWVYSTIDSCQSKMFFNIKGSQYSINYTINLYNEYRIDGALVYVTDFFPLDDYEISFSEGESAISLYCIYYLNIQPLTQSLAKTTYLFPSQTPSFSPSQTPSFSPSQTPSFSPSQTPSFSPSTTPSFSPSQTPSFSPSQTPSFSPSQTPSFSPSQTPSFSPSQTSSFSPFQTPSFSPSQTPSFSPSQTPSFSPSQTPSFSPSTTPSFSPSQTPSFSPSQTPSFSPSLTPSFSPSQTPSFSPSQTPSFSPSQTPSFSPSLTPSFSPSQTPSLSPSQTPSLTTIHSFQTIIETKSQILIETLSQEITTEYSLPATEESSLITTSEELLPTTTTEIPSQVISQEYIQTPTQSSLQFSYQINSKSKTFESLQSEITLAYSLVDTLNSIISGSLNDEMYIDNNQRKKSIDSKIIGIICGLIAVLLIFAAVVAVVLVKKKKSANKLPKEEVKQETTSIKTITTEEKNVFHDSTEDDLNFWL